ncbi:MAG TPA: DUF308 domain-containing protein [Candidatus Elarobacter sp.]
MTIRPRGAPAYTGANDALHRAGIAIRAVAALVLGVFAVARPAYADALIAVFAAFAIVDGAIRIIVALRSTGNDKAWLVHALEGVVGIALGVVVFRVARSLITLTWTVAEWAFIIGVLTIVFAAVTWGRLKDAWLWLLGGILLIALGIALLWVTFGGLLAPGLALGVFALIYGAISLAIAVRAGR